ncbi:MAG: IPT/TIG domain-containing protein, partial [candidate division KSB1 bacterium]|nr:IPT/TIG domain-containing protein [candidate division KSB1 bacterium]
MDKNTVSIYRLLLTFFILSLGLFWRCEYDTPSAIYPIQGAAAPSISRIEPDSAVGGVLEIKIIGQNFAAQVDQNILFIGNTEAAVKQATTTELTVVRPIKLSGPNMIKLAVRDALVIAEFGPYQLEPGLVALPAVGQINSITMDKDENLYAEGDRKILKISPRGEVVEFGTIEFISSAMRIGAGGYLYIQRKDNRDLYRIGPAGGAAERYARIRKRAHFFDFDQNGYIYSGSLKYGLCVTSPDGTTSTEIPGYADAFQINAVRVFNGYVYLSADTITNDPAKYFSGIYRLEIKGNGELGPRELVFDWA